MNVEDGWIYILMKAWIDKEKSESFVEREPVIS